MFKSVLLVLFLLIERKCLVHQTQAYEVGVLKWKFETRGEISSSPIISTDGKTLYFGSWDNSLYALNSNGTLKWSDFVDSDLSNELLLTSDDQILYFGSLYGIFYSYFTNGTRRWQKAIGHIRSGATLSSDEKTIYIGSEDSYFYALYTNGTEKWKYQTTNKILF